MINIEAYTIHIKGIHLEKILENWTWLIGNDKTVLALTKSGDALLKDHNNNLFFLDVGGGQLNLVSNDSTDFTHNRLNNEVLDNFLLPALVDKLEQALGPLGPEQAYSYTTLPILGGEYSADNMYIVSLYEHYDITGRIHFQLKDLPDGASVEIEITD